MNIKKILRIYSDFTAYFIASYFVLRKTSLFSASNLINNTFKPDVAVTIIDWLVSAVVIAIVLKIYFYIKDYFSEIEVSNLEAPHYQCLLRNNKEIEKHIDDLKNKTLSIEVLQEKHSYIENLYIIHINFCKHIINALKSKNNKILEKDIFISFFEKKECDLKLENTKELHFVSHYDPTVFDTETTKFSTSGNTSGFAGSKVIKNKKINYCYKIDNNYLVDDIERRKTINHYIGIPVLLKKQVVAVINVEFHKRCFDNKVQLKNFYKKEMQAFSYLYEYQMYKKYFFWNLKGVHDGHSQ